MLLGSVLTPINERNLRLAAQCGVEGIVARYPGPTLEALLAVQEVIGRHGMRVLAVEGYLPIEKIKLGTDHSGEEMAAMKNLLRNMAKAGIGLLCYNFMSGTDWVRTRVDAPARGGALTTAFRLSDAERAISLNAVQAAIGRDTITAGALWANLERFLREIIPVAEDCGVTMAMHPDDPPLPSFMGKARIMNSVEGFERLVRLVPSERNAICFCLGTFATMGVDIPATIRRLGRHIRYVHFRDARGTAEDFVETFHDNGPTDMAGAMRALREVGFAGPMRPDHVPQLAGEEDGEPGYTMFGRLFAFGYIRGLLHATQPR
jgi:mannonate dehydratase